MQLFNPLPSLLAMAVLFVPSGTQAAVSFTDVWFAEGEIDYVIEPDASGMRDTIQDVMDYFADYTPLEITEATDSGAANLHFEGFWASPNGGGYTYGYWDGNRNDNLQKIRFDSNFPPSRTTVAHEFGHALGWPHEFQRDTRDDHVDVCFNVDPFNYKRIDTLPGQHPYYNLSPYDFASVMNGGYVDTGGCVNSLPGENIQTRDYDVITNILSRHDINAIYRMHGKGLGRNDHGDRFGKAVSSGDYDGDGFKDVVVANIQNEALWLEFFRGVATDSSENVTGLKWMPWFKVVHDNDIVKNDVVLTTGDFNGDGIDDIAVGQPRYNSDQGRVSILFVNTLPSDTAKDGTDADDFAPWGHKGIQHRIDLLPSDYGLVTGGLSGHPPQFGASLAAVRATNYREDENSDQYHDLVIGASEARMVWHPENSAKGAVLIVKGELNNSPASFNVTDSVILWSPDANAGFGTAVAAVPGRCSSNNLLSAYNTDFIAVGAPDFNDERGAIHIYGCATTGDTSTLIQPTLLDSHYAVAEGSRFGHALAGFRIFDGSLRRKHYLAVGQPNYVADSDLSSGRVVVYKISTSGSISFESAFIPATHSGNDQFGKALAVQQRRYSQDNPTDGSNETYIGIGMPGAEVDGHKAGKVYIWRPFNDDGSHNNTSKVVEAVNPHTDTTTRFGMSIAALRPLKQKGGFVAGAPRAITVADDVEAGQVSTLQNGGDDFKWSTIRRNLNQETDGDKRPTN